MWSQEGCTGPCRTRLTSTQKDLTMAWIGSIYSKTADVQDCTHNRLSDTLRVSRALARVAMKRLKRLKHFSTCRLQEEIKKAGEEARWCLAWLTVLYARASLAAR